MKKNIAIVTGGYSEEYEISLESAKIVEENLNILYNLFTIYLEKDNWYIISNNIKYSVTKKDFSVKINNKIIKFDVVFMIIHGTPAEDGKIQDYFDKLKIPYTCCNAETSYITFNKSECNKRLKELGFKCASSYTYHKNQQINYNLISKKIGFPCFIKPTCSGSSFGINKVHFKKDINSAIKEALEYGDEVLIEEFLDGVEVSCGVFSKNINHHNSFPKINTETEIIVLPITEIISENAFFDYEAKYKGKSKEITPARITKNQTKKIQRLTKKIYNLMKLQGICRIDFIITEDIPYIIEINTIPGLSKESIIPKQIKEAGYRLSEIFDLCLVKSINK